MKELTIEEKAKAYDEAVNRMKHYVVDKYGCSRIQVSDVFPELKESEDERIRKEMIEILKKEANDFPSSVIAEKSNSWIDYLERQRPINPTMIEKERIDNAFTKMMLKGQKPIGWSEEDNRKIKFLVNLVNEWCDKAPNATSMVKEEMSDWLKSLKDRVLTQNTWKPSDEQLNALRHAISGCSYDVEPLIEIEKQLKKLNEE